MEPSKARELPFGRTLKKKIRKEPTNIGDGLAAGERNPAGLPAGRRTVEVDIVIPVLESLHSTALQLNT